jgi:hypothetical protein
MAAELQTTSTLNLNLSFDESGAIAQKIQSLRRKDIQLTRFDSRTVLLLLLCWLLRGDGGNPLCDPKMMKFLHREGLDYGQPAPV